MSIVEFLSQPLWQRLGLTLVHFLWQGLAVAVLAGAFVRVFRLNHGNSRYGAYLLTFTAMIFCPIVTFTAIDIPISPNTELVTGAESVEAVDSSSYAALPAGDILPEAETSSPAIPTSAGSIPLGQRISGWLNVSMPWALVIWMAGVVVLSVRLLMGFVGVYRWRHHLEPLPERLAVRVASLTEVLGMRGFSGVFISPAVLQAMAVGYLRPMVLLPAGMLMQMQPEMLEAVIAHELAHIRRLDLWVNLAQRVTETLLFYHPAVWWLSGCLRSERELCCDELAVKATGERITYATTLESVSRARFMVKQPVLAAGLGRDSTPTLGRVRHVLGLTPAQRNCPFWLAGVIAVVFLAALVIPTTLALTSKPEIKTDVKHEQKPSFSVKVVGPDNKPVEHASVFSDSIDRKLNKKLVHNSISYDGGIAEFSDINTTPRLHTIYALTEYTDEPYVGFTQVEINKPNTVVELKLKRAAYLTGTITDKKGMPVPLAYVTPNAILKDFQGILNHAKFRGHTDEAGQFKILAMPGLEYKLQINARESSFTIEPPDPRCIPVIPGETAVQVKGETRFGPVIELKMETMRDDPDDAYSRKCLIDFESGNLFSAPERLKPKQDDPDGNWEELAYQWCKNNGIDTCAYQEDKHPGFTLHLNKELGVFLDADNWVWGSIKPAELLKEIKQENDLATEIRADRLPATFAFRTIEGNCGLVQILGHDRDKMQIRYKMVEPLAAQETGVQSEGGYDVRYFVRLVVGKDEITFQGKETTWEQLPELLGQVGRRDITVLQVGFTEFPRKLRLKSIESTEQWLREHPAWRKAAQLREQFGFEYLSFVGKHKLGAVSGGTRNYLVRPMEFGKEIEVNLPSAEEKPLVNLDTIEFSKDKAVIRGKVTSYPKTKWDIEIAFFDQKMKRLDYVFKNYENSGIIERFALNHEETIEVDISKIKNLEKAEFFELSIKQTEQRDLQTSDRKKTIDLKPVNFKLRFNSKRKLYSLVVSIKNESSISIPEFKLRFYKDDPANNLDEAGNPHRGWHGAGPIEPGKQWNEGTRDFYVPDGEYEFSVVLDYDNTVSETDENNNTASIKVVIKDGQIKKVESAVDVETTKEALTAETLAVSDWRQRFNEVYRLEDDQILKRIAPPFIPERKEYYEKEHCSQPSMISRTPGCLVFHWNDGLRNWGLSFGKNSLGGVLGHCLSIESNKLDAPEELFHIELPGDWIVRMPSTIEERLGALEKILSEEIGRDIRFEKHKVEQEVLVCTGDFKFHPPSETFDHDWVHLSAYKVNPDEREGGGTANSVNEFLVTLGDRIDMTVIDQTSKPPKEIKIPYRNHSSCYLRNEKDDVKRKRKLDMLLASLTEQTELQFTIEKRPVEVWFVIEKNKLFSKLMRIITPHQ